MTLFAHLESHPPAHPTHVYMQQQAQLADEHAHADAAQHSSYVREWGGASAIPRYSLFGETYPLAGLCKEVGQLRLRPAQIASAARPGGVVKPPPGFERVQRKEAEEEKQLPQPLPPSADSLSILLPSRSHSPCDSSPSPASSTRSASSSASSSAASSRKGSFSSGASDRSSPLTIRLIESAPMQQQPQATLSIRNVSTERQQQQRSRGGNRRGGQQRRGRQQ